MTADKLSANNLTTDERTLLECYRLSADFGFGGGVWQVTNGKLDYVKPNLTFKSGEAVPKI